MRDTLNRWLLSLKIAIEPLTALERSKPVQEAETSRQQSLIEKLLSRDNTEGK